MNDVTDALRVKPVIVRPRDAASLILLRGAGNDLELLAGRRPGHVKFMPGVYVFPGGAIDREDNRPWRIETGGEYLPPRLVRSARAALRETWEEVGVLVGRRGAGRGAAVVHGAQQAAHPGMPRGGARYVSRTRGPTGARAGPREEDSHGLPRHPGGH